MKTIDEINKKIVLSGNLQKALLEWAPKDKPLDITKNDEVKGLIRNAIRDGMIPPNLQKDVYTPNEVENLLRTLAEPVMSSKPNCN